MISAASPPLRPLPPLSGISICKMDLGPVVLDRMNPQHLWKSLAPGGGQIASGAGRGATRQPGPFTWRRPPSPGPRAWRNLPGSFPPRQSLLELAPGSVQGAPALISPAAPQGGAGKGRAGQDTGGRMSGMCQAHLPTPGEGRGRGPAEGRGEGRGPGRRRKPVCSPAGGAQSAPPRRPARSPLRPAPRAPRPPPGPARLREPAPRARPTLRLAPRAGHLCQVGLSSRCRRGPAEGQRRGTGPVPSPVTGTTPGLSFPIHNLRPLQASLLGFCLRSGAPWCLVFTVSKERL